MASKSSIARLLVYLLKVGWSSHEGSGYPDSRKSLLPVEQGVNRYEKNSNDQVIDPYLLKRDRRFPGEDINDSRDDRGSVPAVFSRAFSDLGPYGIAADVLEKSKEIAVTIAQDSFVSALEEMADRPVFPVKVHAVTLLGNSLKGLGMKD